ncbi:unnamed protein product [Closterium sp. Yama58-4]|nr:unnamed protein product [Closterium sp. Yama58-4]
MGTSRNVFRVQTDSWEASQAHSPLRTRAFASPHTRIRLPAHAHSPLRTHAVAVRVALRKWIIVLGAHPGQRVAKGGSKERSAAGGPPGERGRRGRGGGG